MSKQDVSSFTLRRKDWCCEYGDKAKHCSQ
jgi:hypothetical protein